MSAADPPGRARLDLVLVARGLAATRAKAQALVLAGRVAWEGRRLDKPGMLVPQDAPLEVTPGRRWVGRGGAKLAPVLETLGLDPRGRDALDVGASTGGFTQALLEAGATRVIALDVGRGQLDWSLRNDPRVLVVEGHNARFLGPESLPWPPSLAVIDVSFISLTLILAPVSSCLTPEADVLALVKPQFELGRGRVGRGGVVRDPAQWDEVLSRLCDTTAADGLGPQRIVRSPLPGATGNVEFFLWLRPGRPARDRAALDAERNEAVHGRIPQAR